MHERRVALARYLCLANTAVGKQLSKCYIPVDCCSIRRLQRAIRLGASHSRWPLNLQLCVLPHRRYQCLVVSKRGRAKGRRKSVIVYAAKSCPNSIYNSTPRFEQRKQNTNSSLQWQWNEPTAALRCNSARVRSNGARRVLSKIKPFAKKKRTLYLPCIGNQSKIFHHANHCM